MDLEEQRTDMQITSGSPQTTTIKQFNVPLIKLKKSSSCVSADVVLDVENGGDEDWSEVEMDSYSDEDTRDNQLDYANRGRLGLIDSEMGEKI